VLVYVKFRLSPDVGLATFQVRLYRVCSTVCVMYVVRIRGRLSVSDQRAGMLAVAAYDRGRRSSNAAAEDSDQHACMTTTSLGRSCDEIEVASWICGSWTACMVHAANYLARLFKLYYLVCFRGRNIERKSSAVWAARGQKSYCLHCLSCVS
jgi:hypothetical protein